MLLSPAADRGMIPVLPKVARYGEGTSHIINTMELLPCTEEEIKTPGTETRRKAPLPANVLQSPLHNTFLAVINEIQKAESRPPLINK